MKTNLLIKIGLCIVAAPFAAALLFGVPYAIIDAAPGVFKIFAAIPFGFGVVVVGLVLGSPE